jgi:hypothetical protein
MRSLFKLALIGAAALALFAGGASAQDATVKVGFSVMNAFGPWTDSTEVKYTDTNDVGDKLKTDSSRMINEFQTDWDITGTAGPVTARAKIRFRDSGNAPTSSNPPSDLLSTSPVVQSERVPDTNRADVYWKVNDLFTLGLMARSLGLPASSVAYGVYNSSTCSGGCSIGEVTAPVGFFANARGVDLRFNVAGMTIGAMLLDDCIPGCGYTVTTATTAGVSSSSQGATKDEAATVPYFMGAFGPVTLGAYLISASGKVPGKTVNGQDTIVTTGGVNAAVGTDSTKDKDTTVKEDLMDVNLAVDLGMAKIGFELFTISQSCDKKVLNAFGTGVLTCSALDTAGNVIGTKINVGPGRIEAHLSTVESKSSAKANDVAGSEVKVKATTTDMMVGYAIPINANFTLNPIYASNTSVTTVDFTPQANGTVVTATTTGKLETTRNRTFIALAGRAAF